MSKGLVELPPCPFDDLPVKWHVPADYDEAVEMLRRARRDINKLSALAAQQEPVQEHERMRFADALKQIIDYPINGEEAAQLKLIAISAFTDTAPPSGVREGMLRAAEICKEWEAKLSQGAGYAIRTARDAITRAADQVNAENFVKEESSTRTNTRLWDSAPPSASQPDTVAVPRGIVLRAALLLETAATYGIQSHFDNGDETPNAAMCKTASNDLSRIAQEAK